MSGTSHTDLFAFRIHYNKPDSQAGTALYNGNISETIWRSRADNTIRRYSYSYDAMNRINNARFGLYYTTTANDRYNEGGITYDKNGNILSLERRGLVASSGTTDTFGVIDKLTYTYGQYTNRLDRVLDDGNDTAGYIDGVDIALEYHYDANGNMVKDFNKKIGTTSTNGITYNYLNLPLTIMIDEASTLKKIEYVYDAVGTKLKKTVTTGTSIDITEYCGGFVYNRAGATANALLQFFPTEEGYVTIAANGDFKYTYQYKDHLGNVRLSYTDTNGNNAIVSGEVIEESNYSPFGLQHKGYNNVVSIQNGNTTAQKWKYNDTEYNESHLLNMYEMPLRSYDPALARWTSIDPVVHFSLSTYNAFDNNPVFWADPSGADAYNTIMGLFKRSGSGITIYARDSFFAGGNIFGEVEHIDDKYFASYQGYQEEGAEGNEVLNFKVNILQRFKGSGLDPYAEVKQGSTEEANQEIQNVINKIIGLYKYWEIAGEPSIKFAGRSSQGDRGLTLGRDILIYNGAFSSYVWLASTLFHEISHAYQYKYFPGMETKIMERQAYGTEWRLAPIHLKMSQRTNYESVMNQYNANGAYTNMPIIKFPY